MKHPAARSIDHLAASPPVRQAAFTLLAVAFLLVPGAPAARAASAISNTWDPGHTVTYPGSGGSGTWDLTTANWIQFSGQNSDNAYVNNASGATYFEGTAGTVNLNVSGVITPYVELYTPGYVVQDTPGTSYALTIKIGGIDGQNTSGTVTFSVPSSLTSTSGGSLTVVAGGTLAVTAPLTVGNALFIGGDTTNGTVIVSGNNTIGGATTVRDGVAVLAATGTNQPLGGTNQVSVVLSTLMYGTGSSNQIPAAVPMTLNNGTFNVNGQSQDQAHALGALTLSSSSALDFGSGVSGSSVLAFGNSSGVAWSGTLSVYDYRGTPGAGGGVDQLFFGTDATGLTTSQLGEVSFYSGGSGSTLLGTGMILSDGEVTYAPVPEPATWLGGVLLGFGAAASRWRRRQRSQQQGGNSQVLVILHESLGI